jgi:hypothetical protein
MPKTFYTERDIVDLAGQGAKVLEVDDTIVLTDLARDAATKHGIRLVRRGATHPEDTDQAELAHRVKAAVIARLGEQVDAQLLDSVVARVLAGLK